MKIKLPPLSESAKNQISRHYAQHFINEVLPLLSGMDKREKCAAVAFETNRMLSGYEEWLVQACDRFQDMANEAIAYSLPKLLILRGASENGGKDK